MSSPGASTVIPRAVIRRMPSGLWLVPLIAAGCWWWAPAPGFDARTFGLAVFAAACAAGAFVPFMAASLAVASDRLLLVNLATTGHLARLHLEIRWAGCTICALLLASAATIVLPTDVAARLLLGFVSLTIFLLVPAVRHWRMVMSAVARSSR